MALPASLSQFNITHISFIQNCSNIALGVRIYNDYFSPDSPFDEPATDYQGNWIGWQNSTPPEWMQFWRAALPHQYQTTSAQAIDQWANQTECFNFFAYSYDPSFESDYVDFSDANEFLNGVATLGSCQWNQSMSTNDERWLSDMDYTLTDMVVDCMVSICCPLGQDTGQITSLTLFPGTNWTYEDACSFYTCSADNQGNPDLGGIGIVVAYYIEAALTVATWIMAIANFFVESVRLWRPQSFTQASLKQPFGLWQRHAGACLDASTIFLDASVYFSLSVSFASIFFNYREQPLLYEDKLGQASSLLAVNTPVTILLLIYQEPGFERHWTRLGLVCADVLMTFINQFLFHHAKYFNRSGVNFCLDWQGSMSRRFDRLFIIKAVWAGIMVIFFASHFMPWNLRNLWGNQRSREVERQRKRPQREGGKLHVRAFITKFGTMIRVSWRKILAILLALYGIIDSFIEIQFIRDLRNAERDIAKTDNEDAWGYGQVLAVLIWLPIFVEYLHGLLRGSDERKYESASSKAKKATEERGLDSPEKVLRQSADA